MASKLGISHFLNGLTHSTKNSKLKVIKPKEPSHNKSIKQSFNLDCYMALQQEGNSACASGVLRQEVR
jgi:hypothetical protein